MLLSKEEYLKRRMPNLKAHQWFGSDFIRDSLSKHYDVYIDDERTLFYVFDEVV